MTEQQRLEWAQKRCQLPPEHAEQWTEEVYEAYLLLRESLAAWRKKNGRPSNVLGCVKDDGMLTPVFIPNDPYIRYQLLQKVWVRDFEPEYIKENRARMSKGDFDGEDDWNITDPAL